MKRTAIIFAILVLNVSGVEVRAGPLDSFNWALEQIEMPQAWKLVEGSKQLKVAIIDTGVDVNHPELKENLWINPGETGLDSQGRNKAANGIDDDGNGFIDDVHGWNFVDDNPDIRDHHGHGTHIAGIIGARGYNSLGVRGVAPNVSMMILKYYDPNSPNLTSLPALVRAIRYAVAQNVHIINFSGGGLSRSALEESAVRMAMQKGILFVAAAGNEKSNSDRFGFYPADYDLPNILSVAAINQKKKMFEASNYGVRTVDLVAPGEEILSTLPNGKYGYMSGTSQATAFVSGVAALLMSREPNIRDPQKWIRFLVQTGDSDLNLRGKTKYQARLNTYRALAMKDTETSAFGAVAENTSELSTVYFSSQLEIKEDSALPLLPVAPKAQ
jgi:thermitase